MPGFIGSRSSVERPGVGVIYYFIVGPSLTAICPTTAITMTAIVVGSLTGHSILWELIDGPSVTWLTPQAQLSVQWTSATSADRVFRFWIDKGLPWQQYKDKRVYGTPTDFFAYQTTQLKGTIEPGRSFTCATPETHIVPASGLPGIYASNAGCVGVPWTFFWNEVTCSNARVIDYTVQESNNGGNTWTTIGVFSDPSSILTTAGRLYRVVTRYTDGYGQFNLNNNDNMYITTTDPAYAPTLAETGVLGTEWAVDSFVGSNQGGIPLVFNRVVIERTLKVFNPAVEPQLNDNFYGISTPFRANVFNLVVIERTLKIFDPTVEPQLNDNFYGISSAQYARVFNVVVSGGVVIGG